MAKIAEQAERYDEMAEFMAKLAAAADELSVEERNLLAVAYKNVIGYRRASWRKVTAVEQKEAMRGDFHLVSVIGRYISKVEYELSSVCYGVLDLLDSKLLPSASTADGKAFFFKMRGDYNRYLAEFKAGSEREDASEKALSAYKAAQEIASAELLPTNPIRLGVALNFAVFYYEILNDPACACSIAKMAFDEAIGETELLEEDSHRESALIMQLLRDNLTLWTSDMQYEGGDKREVVDRD